MEANAAGIPSDHCADSDQFVSDDSACGIGSRVFFKAVRRMCS